MLRDPTASLVHELAHAAQDCSGLNPGEHELEAVRIENIYRRASGLPSGPVRQPARTARDDHRVQAGRVHLRESRRRDPGPCRRATRRREREWRGSVERRFDPAGWLA
jgi:hypothetical protein